MQDEKEFVPDYDPVKSNDLPVQTYMIENRKRMKENGNFT